MAEFGLLKSFNIDNGELDSLSPQECFVLGYELAMIDEAIKRNAAIHQPVHNENRERIDAAFEKAGRRHSLNWMPGDASEAWLLLESPSRQE